MAQGGDFNIDVWDGVCPIWVVLRTKNGITMQFNALELRDLEYAVRQARREAQWVAERMDPKRVQDY
jgi:hypothetical protein